MHEFAFTVSVVTSVRVLADNAHDAREALDAAIGTLSTGHVKIADEVDHSLHENAVIKDIRFNVEEDSVTLVNNGVGR